MSSAPSPEAAAGAPPAPVQQGGPPIWPWLVGGFLVRLLALLCGSDRLSEPDAAETKLLDWARAQAEGGPLPMGEVLRLLRSGPNAPHGGTWLVAGPVAVVTALSGVEWGYAALKTWGLLLQCAGLWAWSLASAAVAGPGARPWVTILLAFPPPLWFALSLVPWGSHPEAAALLGLPLLWHTRRGWSLGAAFGFGAVAALDLLVVPSVLCLWWAQRVRLNASANVARLALFALPIGATLWLTGGLSASVTEEPMNQPLALLGLLTDRLGLVGESVLGLLRLELAPPDWAPRALGIVAIGVVVAALWWTARLAPSSVGRITFVPTLVLLVTVLLFAPRRPDVPARYLVLLWPPLALGVGSALAACARRSTTLAAVAAFSLTGPLLLWLPDLVDPRRAPGFPRYQPERWVRLDIGHFGYDDVEALAAIRVRCAGGERGIALVTGTGAAERPPWSRRLPLDAPRIRQRIEATSWADGPETATRREEACALGLTLGWLGVDQPSEVAAVLPALGARRWDVAAALGTTPSVFGERHCEALLALSAVDRDAASAEACGSRLAPSPPSLP